MFLEDLSAEQQEALLCLAHDVVVSDGDLRPGETQIMEDLRREMRIRDDFEPRYMAVGEARTLFSSRRARLAALLSLIRVAYADRSYEIEEQCFLQDLRHAFDISDQDFDTCETWVKRFISLEQEAVTLFG